MMKNGSLSEIISLISGRIDSYYPNVAQESVRINGRLLKKCHKSDIYGIDITDGNGFSKHLIVKKRRFNEFYENEVEKRTQHEYSVLKNLNDLPDLSFYISNAVDTIPGKGILITEMISGRILPRLLRKWAYLPGFINKNRKDNEIFRHIGVWLREFHKSGDSGKTEAIDTDGCMKKAKAIAGKFEEMGIRKEIGEKLLKKMETLKEAVGHERFPLVLKHGDFQPMNIIVKGTKVTAIDIKADTLDISIKDVVNFLTGLEIIKIKYPGGIFYDKRLEKAEESFLSGYYEQSNLPVKAIEFMKILWLLEQFEGMYTRNANNIKRNMISRFFKDRHEKVIA
jgi:hypothetical protein